MRRMKWEEEGQKEELYVCMLFLLPLMLLLFLLL